MSRTISNQTDLSTCVNAAALAEAQTAQRRGLQQDFCDGNADRRKAEGSKIYLFGAQTQMSKTNHYLYILDIMKKILGYK